MLHPYNKEFYNSLTDEERVSILQVNLFEGFENGDRESLVNGLKYLRNLIEDMKIETSN